MEIGIVGAGIAGLGAAYELRGTDADVTLLEKSRGVGGRAATRRKNGCTYDHGANYVTPDPELEAFMRELGEPAGIDDPVWTFDAEETIEPGEDRDRPSLTYEDGIRRFAKEVLAECDAALETETRVESIAREGERWRVESEERRYGFDALALTPPAPRTAALLADTDWDAAIREELVEAIEAVPYRTILSLVLHYPFELDRPYYALVNTDKGHEISWFSREECKPGHVPDGESLLIVQMAPDWSLERYGEPEEAVAGAAAGLAADLLEEPPLESPDWTDCGRWRHALPDEGANTDVLARAEDDALYFAGDWVVGEGRVAAAFENGRELGERLLQQRDEPL
ncbi:NAD(P)/FAD-dependent oxidoreductase [Halalkalicoccus tibetensis]|uniref:NAD(P)/FAD-dependent oxidoreductase n=1 Tax=Halalkalicoccus tibetensis TaxID=175632 RepID=A0ABD5V2G3_9EURY